MKELCVNRRGAVGHGAEGNVFHLFQTNVSLLPCRRKYSQANYQLRQTVDIQSGRLS